MVEDDETIGIALHFALSADGYDVRVLDTGERAGAAIDDFRPSAAVVDLRLPHGPDGIAVLQTIKQKGATPVLMMSASDPSTSVLASLNAGADDFLPKPFAVAELSARVGALLARTRERRDTVVSVADVTIDKRARSALRGQSELFLTCTEFELLAAFADHAGLVLSRDQLAHHASRDHARPTTSVESHLSALRRKLEHHGPRIIHTVREVGYVLRP